MNKQRERERERENVMKLRIRGLVSVHEIPFSSRTLQREEGNCPHYTERGREGGMGGKGERWRRIAKNLFLCFPRATLHGCRPTNDITFINTGSCFFFLSLFGKEEEREGGSEGEKSDIGLETCYCLASRTASQPGSSVREKDRVRARGWERERKGETVAMVTSREMQAHLFICWPRERARRALSLSRCACVRVCAYMCVHQRVCVGVHVCVCV